MTAADPLLWLAVMKRREDPTIRRLKKRLALEGGISRQSAELRERVLAKIRDLKADGWKQSEIAEALGLSQTMVSRYVNGRRRGASTAKEGTSKRAPSPVSLRPVEVTRESAPNSASSEKSERGRTLVLSAGARIEGLSLDDVVELARRLS